MKYVEIDAITAFDKLYKKEVSEKNIFVQTTSNGLTPIEQMRYPLNCLLTSSLFVLEEKEEAE